LGTERGEGKRRDIPYGECGVKKLERKVNEDSRKNRNAFSIPLLWLLLSATSASCVAGCGCWHRLVIGPFGCGCWLRLRVVPAGCGCWLRLQVVPAGWGCWLLLELYLSAVAVGYGCELYLSAVAVGFGCELCLPPVAVGSAAASCACRPWLLVTAAGCVSHSVVDKGSRLCLLDAAVCYGCLDFCC
jgi:hypothetical protein